MVAVVAYLLAAIYRRYVSAAHRAVEHTVHHHRAYVARLRGIAVVAHDASHVGAAAHLGIAVAVHHSRRSVEQARDAAHISRAAHAAARAQHAAVVDARGSACFANDGSHVGSAAYVCVVDDDVAYRCSVGICHERLVFARYGLQSAVDDAAERLLGRSHRAVHREAGCQMVGAFHHRYLVCRGYRLVDKAIER